MNWLDFVLLGTLAVCAAVGLKLGLIKAILVAVAVYVGGLVAGRLSGGVGEFLSGLVSIEGDIGGPAEQDGPERDDTDRPHLRRHHRRVPPDCPDPGQDGVRAEAWRRWGCPAWSTVVEGCSSDSSSASRSPAPWLLGLAALTYGTDYDDALSGISSTVALQRVDLVVSGFEGGLVGSGLVSVYLDVFDRLARRRSGLGAPQLRSCRRHTPG